MTIRIAATALIGFGLLASAPAGAQEVAGRVLLSVGIVTVERGAERIPARTGTEIRTGDTVLLGAQSNAQLLMTDESIVALRPDTTFRVKEYAFRGQAPEQQRAFFELLKGGIRTVTGLIGRLQQQNYGVVTPTATVGIRGTHYTLVFCPERCEQPERVSLASAQLVQSDVIAQTLPAGGQGELVGSVTDGRIAVTNLNNQTAEFGADQYFRQIGASRRSARPARRRRRNRPPVSSRAKPPRARNRSRAASRLPRSRRPGQAARPAIRRSPPRSRSPPSR